MSDENRRQRQVQFEPYWEKEAVEAGLAAGTLVQGVLRTSSTKLSVAHVRPKGSNRANERNDVLVKGKSNRNRAVHGDVVAVKLLDTTAVLEEDAQPAGVLDEEDVVELTPPQPVSDDSSDSDEEVVLRNAVIRVDDEEDGREQETRLQASQQLRGAVVAILEPRGTRRVIVCTLHPNDSNDRNREDGEVTEDDTLLKAKPTDCRMPWILIQINDVTRSILNIPERKLDRYQLWPVQMIIWRESSSLPLGRLKGQCLGQAGDLDAEEKHALIEHELIDHDIDFEDQQIDEVEELVREAKRNFNAEVGQRLDLRHKRIFTIDPSTAKDLDDAIHVDEDRAAGEVEIGVHIADVTHFLKMGSLTDKEAKRRTTSVYLINRVLPMLPHALCNHLCSLNPNESKLSFSVVFRLKRDTGELCQHPAPVFKKTAMRSCCRLNYDEVQDMLDGKAIEEPPVSGGYTWQDIRNDIFLLYEVCGKVRRGRLAGGALTITREKTIFHTLESEDGIPTGYHLESHSASHWIIEELMLYANRIVAEFLANSRLSLVSVLRNHAPPHGKKPEALKQMLSKNLGLEWENDDAGRLYRSCQAIYKKYGRTLGLCVEFMVMRSGMCQAEYFVYNGETDPHHFALNFDYYTHFTSPIRRYTDVMVHRVLTAVLSDAEEGFEGQEAADDLVKECNEKKQAARKCNMQMDRAVFCIYLRARKEWLYTIGTVLYFDTKSEGVTVYCAQLGKESVAQLKRLEGQELFTGDVNDELLLPVTWRFQGRGRLELEWEGPEPERKVKFRQLQTLSCVPIVIIPTHTVPINYATFFVSPFHRRCEEVAKEVPGLAATGFPWREVEQEGFQTVYDAAAIASTA